MDRIYKIFLPAIFFVLLWSVSVISFASEEEPKHIAMWDISEGEDDIVTAKLFETEGGYYELLITGDGRMKSFSSASDVPWLQYSDKIIYVHLTDRIENLSLNSIASFAGLLELRIDGMSTVLNVSEQPIPYNVKIFAHAISTMAYYVYDNNPERLFYICDFKDGKCDTCKYECISHKGGVAGCLDYGICDICKTEYLAPLGHRFSELQDEIPPTCTSDGFKSYYTCDVCGALFDENEQPSNEAQLKLPATHNFGEIIAGTDPTCTEDGIKSHYKCFSCYSLFDENRQVIDSIAISKLGHQGGVANCLSGAICNVCMTVYTEPDSQTHEYSDDMKFDGEVHWNECECGAKTARVVHLYSDNVIKNATETEEGILESVCECGFKIEKSIPKLESTESGDQSNENVTSDKDIDEGTNGKSSAWVVILIIFSTVLPIGVAVLIIVLKKKNIDISKLAKLIIKRDEK